MPLQLSKGQKNQDGKLTVELGKSEQGSDKAEVRAGISAQSPGQLDMVALIMKRSQPKSGKVQCRLFHN